LCLKSQIPSTKLQINFKFQYLMTKLPGRDIVWIFEFWSLLFV
jgi:hypothetical protein